MNAGRLLELATLLETADEKHFNLGEWYEVNPECEYTACAIGCALFHEPFREEGFLPVRADSGCLEPSYRGEENWIAVETFFELSIEEAEYLFMDEFYVNKEKTSPREVSQRIRTFVEKGGRG